MALAKLARDLDPPTSDRFPPLITHDIMTVIDGAPIGQRESAPMLVGLKPDVPATPSIFQCTVPLYIKDSYTPGVGRPIDHIENYRVFVGPDAEFFWERVVLRLGGYSSEEVKKKRPQHYLFGTLRNPRDVIKLFAAQLNKKADTFMNFVTLVAMQYWMIAQGCMLMYTGLSESYPKYLWALSANISMYDPNEDEHRSQPWTNIWDEARAKKKTESKESGVGTSTMTRFLYRVLIHEIGLSAEEAAKWCRTKIKQQSQNFYPSRSFTAMSALKHGEDPEIETKKAKFHRNAEYKRKEITGDKEPHHKWTYQAHRMMDPFKPLLDLEFLVRKSPALQAKIAGKTNDVVVSELLKEYPLDKNNDLTRYICLEMARCTQNTEFETNYKTKYTISETQIRKHFETMEPSAFYTWYLGSDSKRKSKGTEVRSAIKLNRPKPFVFSGKTTDRVSHWAPHMMAVDTIARIFNDPAAVTPIRFGSTYGVTEHVTPLEFRRAYRRRVLISHAEVDTVHMDQYCLTGGCRKAISATTLAIRIDNAPEGSSAGAAAASKKRKAEEMDIKAPVDSKTVTQLEYERLRWLCRHAYAVERKRPTGKAASGLAWDNVETKEQEETTRPNLFRAQQALWLIAKHEKFVVRTLFDIWVPKNPLTGVGYLDHTGAASIKSFHAAWKEDTESEFKRRRAAFDAAVIEFTPPEPDAGTSTGSSSSVPTQVVATSANLAFAIRTMVEHFHGPEWSGHDCVSAALRWLMSDKVFASKQIMSALFSSFKFRLIGDKGVPLRLDETDLSRGQLIHMLTAHLTSNTVPPAKEWVGTIKFVQSYRHPELAHVPIEGFAAAFTQAMYDMLILPVVEWIEVSCPLPGPRFANGTYHQESPRWLDRGYSLVRRAVSGVRAEIDQKDFKDLVNSGEFLQHWPQKTSQLGMLLLTRDELGAVESTEAKRLCQSLDVRIDDMIREYMELRYRQQQTIPKLEYVPDHNGDEGDGEERPAKRAKLEKVKVES